jgi:glycosyltransferase involved in cell wall biosynthesis
MPETLLTIGMPLYNEEKYVMETLLALTRQSYKDFRVIVSDNNSDDASYELVKEIADTDERFTIIRQKEKVSAIENFKTVLKGADTIYFMWLGAHDILLENYLDSAMKMIMGNEKLSLVYPRVTPIDSEGKSLEGITDRNDDLETAGLNQVERLTKVAQNAFSGYAIYGIMKTAYAKTIPFRKMVGPDHFALFHLAVYGDIQRLQQTGIAIRIHRNETDVEKNIRLVQEGIISPHDTMMYENHALNYFLYLLKTPAIPIYGKFQLASRLRKVFKKKFHISRKGLVKSFLYKMLNNRPDA